MTQDPAATRAGTAVPARRLLALARPHWIRLSLATLCLALSSAGFLALPYMIRLLTDSVFVHHDLSALNRLSALLVALVLVTAIFGFARGYLVGYAGAKIVADLRVRVYRHLLTLSVDFFDEHRTGDLISSLTADTTLVQTVVTNDLLSGLQDVLTLIVVIVIVLVLDWRLALITFAVAPVVAIAGAVVGRRTRALSENAQTKLGQAGIVLEETLPSIRVVKAFGRSEFENARYAREVLGAFASSLSATRIRSAFESTMLTAAFGAITAVLWFGGKEVLAGHLTPGGLLSFLFYLTMLVGPLQGLASLYGEFQQALGGASRIFALIDTSPSVVDAVDARPLNNVQGDVRFEHVSFQYPRTARRVLHNVSLHAYAGQRVALVGPSGAGKTTLVSLLPRFYDVLEGRILVDGQDIANATLSSVREAVAMVPQDVTLFGGSIRENIAYGRLGASPAEIEDAARYANAHEFILGLPNGYDTQVGERGIKLSGGQRQRIAIARAILKDAPILILDEATSSLDNESEAVVQDALERLMEGRTTFVIAHRLTTIEAADCIAVLQAGEVVEMGTHRDLLARGGLYHRLYTRDFTPEFA